MTTDQPPPILANASPLPDQFAAGLRTFGVAIGVVSTVLGFVGKHDLTGLIGYLQSEQFVAGGGAALGLGALIYGQWKTRHRAKQLAAVASDARVPDAVAALK